MGGIPVVAGCTTGLWIAGGQIFLAVLRHLSNVLAMAIGTSGRIVIDVDPEVKRQLYAALAISGISLKSWFLKEAVEYSRKAGKPVFEPGGESETRGLDRNEFTKFTGA